MVLFLTLNFWKVVITAQMCDPPRGMMPSDRRRLWPLIEGVMTACLVFFFSFSRMLVMEKCCLHEAFFVIGTSHCSSFHIICRILFAVHWAKEWEEVSKFRLQWLSRRDNCVLFWAILLLPFLLEIEISSLSTCEFMGWANEHSSARTYDATVFSFVV